MSDAQAIVDRALFILTPPLRENVRLQIEAAISARTKELEERIRDAELALTTWDDGHNSEYWLRHAPTPPTASVIPSGIKSGDDGPGRGQEEETK